MRAAHAVYVAATCHLESVGVESTRRGFIPLASEVAASSVDEVRDELGVDYLLYLDREQMNEAARAGNPKIERFCNACFTGEYPTPDVTLERLKAIEGERSEHRDNTPVPGRC